MVFASLPGIFRIGSPKSELVRQRMTVNIRFIKSIGPACGSIDRHFQRCSASAFDVSTADKQLATQPEERSVLGRDILAGVLLGLVVATYSVSYAALVFPAGLSDSLPLGLGLFLCSAIIAAVVVAWRGSLAISLAGPDTPATAVLAAAAVTLVARVEPGEAASLVILLGAGTAVVTGALLLGIGSFKRAQSLRFLPYPVVGGFLAASGWFLIVGALRMVEVSVSTPIMVPDPVALTVAVVVAFTLGIGERFWNSPILIPTVLVVGSGFTLFGLWSAGADPFRYAMPLGTGPEYRWIWSEVMTLDVAALGPMSGEIGAIIIVSAIAVVLNTTGLEVSLRRRADLDRDFLANGFANLAIGAAGGFPANVSMNRTLLSARAGARGRAAALVAASVLVVLMLGGGQVLQGLPVPVLAGLLLWFGISVLRRWVWQERRRLSRFDHTLLIGIAVLVVTFGYLVATVLGLVASCLIFAIAYARVRVVRATATCSTYSSRVDRAPEEAAFLSETGERTRLYWLQGFLFFGTAHTLLARLRDDVADEKTDIVILDFRRVTGADSSAAFSFFQIRQLAEDKGVVLACAGMGSELDSLLRRDGFFSEGDAHSRRFDDLDQAVEWAEERMISDSGIGRGADGSDQWLAHELGGRDYARRLTARLRSVTLQQGELLYDQGAPSDTIDFVLNGRVSVMLRLPTQSAPLRLRSMSHHTILGEMGFYRGATRGAAVVADEESRLLRLDVGCMARIENEDPDLAQRVHRMIVATLAGRLESANRELSGLKAET